MTKNNYYKLLSYILFFLCLGQVVDGQQNTLSPYTLLGMGEPVLHNYGQQTGMAGLGIGLRIKNSLNSLNPAALSSIDSLAFIFDLSLSGGTTTYGYKGDAVKQTTGNLQKLAMGFRSTPKWGTSIGLQPFTQTGYKLYTTQYIEGTSTAFRSLNEGKGGLSQVYMANSYTIWPNLSVGLTASYVFGNITQTESTESGEFGNSIAIESRMITHKIMLSGGAQYYANLTPETRLILGVTYTPATRFRFNQEFTIQQNGSGIIESADKRTKQLQMPTMLGLGASIHFKDRWTIGADYQFANWGSVSSQSSVKYINSHLFKVGGEYASNRRTGSYVSKIRYQAGGVYNLTPYSVAGIQLKEIGATIGFGFPLQGMRSALNLSVEAGQRTGSASAVSQKYVKASINLSLIDLWFMKRKFD